MNCLDNKELINQLRQMKMIFNNNPIGFINEIMRQNPQLNDILKKGNLQEAQNDLLTKLGITQDEFNNLFI